VILDLGVDVVPVAPEDIEDRGEIHDAFSAGLDLAPKAVWAEEDDAVLGVICVT
jgi:hypothetical protein